MARLLSLCVLFLKVYDGEWSFMEEFAYKLLIDTIIDQQEIEGQASLVRFFVVFQSRIQLIGSQFLR